MLSIEHLIMLIVNIFTIVEKLTKKASYVIILTILYVESFKIEQIQNT